MAEPQTFEPDAISGLLGVSPEPEESGLTAAEPPSQAPTDPLSGLLGASPEEAPTEPEAIPTPQDGISGMLSASPEAVRPEAVPVEQPQDALSGLLGASPESAQGTLPAVEAEIPGSIPTTEQTAPVTGGIPPDESPLSFGEKAILAPKTAYFGVQQVWNSTLASVVELIAENGPAAAQQLFADDAQRLRARADWFTLSDRDLKGFGLTRDKATGKFKGPLAGRVAHTMYSALGGGTMTVAMGRGSAKVGFALVEGIENAAHAIGTEESQLIEGAKGAAHGYLVGKVFEVVHASNVNPVTGASAIGGSIAVDAKANGASTEEAVAAGLAMGLLSLGANPKSYRTNELKLYADIAAKAVKREAKAVREAGLEAAKFTADSAIIAEIRLSKLVDKLIKRDGPKVHAKRSAEVARTTETEARGEQAKALIEPPKITEETVTRARASEPATPREGSSTEVFENTLAKVSPEEMQILAPADDLGGGTLPTPTGGATNSAAKRIIHRATGLYKVRDLVDVDTAVELGRSLAEREKAGKVAAAETVRTERAKSRDALKAQREKSNDTLKAAKAHSLEKQKEATMARLARKEYLALVAKVKAAPSKSIHPDDQRRIIAIQDGINLEAVTKGEVKRALETMKSAEGGAPVPQSIVKQVSKRALGDMTVAELRSVVDDIADATGVGTLKAKLIAGDLTRRIGSQSALLTQQLESVDRVLFARATDGVAPERGQIGRTEAGVMNIARPARVFEKLDGFTNGPWSQLLWRPWSDASFRAQDRWMTTASNFSEALKGMSDKHKIPGGEAGFMADVLDREVSVGSGPMLLGSERVGIAMLAKNDRGKLTKGHLERTDGSVIPAISEKQVDDIVGSLTQAETDFADYISQRFREQGPEVQRVHETLTGERLDLEIEHFPNLGRSQEPGDVNVGDAGNLAVVFQSNRRGSAKTVGDNFTKGKKPDARQTVLIDALNVFTRNTKAVDWYLEVGPEVSRIRRVLNNPDIVAAIRKKGKARGGRILPDLPLEKWLDDWVEEAGRPQVRGAVGSADQTVAWFRKHAVPGVLGLRLGIVLTQSVSGFMKIADSGQARSLLKWQAVVMKEQVKLLSPTLNPAKNPIVIEMEKKFPEVMHRTVDRDIGEFQRTVRTRGNGATQKLEQKTGKLFDHSMDGIRNVDKLTVTFVAKTAYENAKEAARSAGLPEADVERYAIEQAKRDLERNQPDSRPGALPRMFAEPGEISRMLTLFQNQVNQNQNIHIATLEKMYGGHQKVFGKQTALWILAGFGMSSLILSIVRRGAVVPGGDDEESAMSRIAEQLPKEIMSQATGGIPFIGEGLTSAAARAAEGRFPDITDVTLGTVADAGIGRLSKGLAVDLPLSIYRRDIELAGQSMLNILSGGLTTIGGPGEALRLGVQGAQDIAAGDATPEALFFSRNQRRPAAGGGKFTPVDARNQR